VPLPLSRARAPFCDPEWLFELKWDGFRSLLYSDRDSVRLVSRKGNTFKSFPGLCEGLAAYELLDALQWGILGGYS